MERLYINGGSHGSTVVSSGSYNNWDVNDLFNIGNEAGSERPFSGLIRLVAVYDRALSPSEVQQNVTRLLAQMLCEYQVRVDCSGKQGGTNHE